MDNLRVLLAFAALLALALGFVRLGVRSALAPLCAVAGVSLWLSLFGALGVLRLGGILLYVLAVVCAAVLLYEGIAKRRRLPGSRLEKAAVGANTSQRFAHPQGGVRPQVRLSTLGVGFWFFAVGGLFFILLLWAKQPLLTEWDEFSLWGPAQKLMKLNDELYTTAPVGWARLYTDVVGEVGWIQTQKPAYMVFGYFFQLLGVGFAPWQAYAACDVFLLSAMACLFAPFERRFKRHWNAILPLALAALLLPFVFYHYQQLDGLSPAYVDTLADMPLGLCFGAVLACRYGARRRGGLAGLPALLGLALLTMMKDTGFALALVAAVLVAVDVWLCAKGGAGLRRRNIGWGRGSADVAVADTAKAGVAKRGLARIRLAGRGLPQNRWFCAGAQLCAGLAVVFVPFALWEGYISTLTGASRMDSAVTTGGPGMLQFPVLFVQDLLAAEKSARFTQVTGGMLQQFLHSRGNMLGTGLVVAALCLGLVVLAAVLYKSPLFRRRCLCFGLLSSLGFAAYYLLLTMMYLYLFRPEQAAEFSSYERYVYTYYIGWLFASLALLGLAICRARGRRRLLAKLAVLGFAALLFLRVGQLAPAQYTVFGVHADEFAPQRVFAEKVAALKTRLAPDGRTFLVKSDDIGLGWFMYCYEMLPWQMDYSFGGTMELRRAGPDGVVTPHALTPEEWRQYLAETGCTTVLVDFADYDFIQTYGAVFSDGMAAYQNGETDLYAVAPQGGTVVLEPVLS